MVINGDLYDDYMVIMAMGPKSRHFFYGRCQSETVSIGQFLGDFG